MIITLAMIPCRSGYVGSLNTLEEVSSLAPGISVLVYTAISPALKVPFKTSSDLVLGDDEYCFTDGETKVLSIL